MSKKYRASVPSVAARDALERSGWDEADEERYNAQEEGLGLGAGETAVPSETLAPSPSTQPSIANGLAALALDRPKLDFAEQVLAHLVDETEGYQQRHIELQLSEQERSIVSRLRLGLSARGVVLNKRGPGGCQGQRKVENAADVVRWLIQQVALLATTAVAVSVAPADTI